jgi:hypothetical protein
MQELIAYFPSIQHGPNRKRRLQKSFATGISLPSFDLATIRGYKDTSTDTRVEQFFYCFLYSMQWEHVYRAVT